MLWNTIWVNKIKIIYKETSKNFCGSVLLFFQNFSKRYVFLLMFQGIVLGMKNIRKIFIALVSAFVLVFSACQNSVNVLDDEEIVEESFTDGRYAESRVEKITQ